VENVTILPGTDSVHSCLLNFFGAAGIEELNHPYILSSIQTVPSLIGQGIFDQDHIV
jgi:hypothetical protein